jgi:hypothetical protein
MKINRDETIKNHFDSITLLTGLLAKHKLSVIHHTYDYLCFGNWEIIIGAGHNDRRFVWDGRDFFLIVSDRKKNNLAHGGQWKVAYELPIGEVSEKDLFEKVYQLAIEIKKN